MNTDPSIVNALRELKARRIAIDRAISALEELTGSRDGETVTRAAGPERNGTSPRPRRRRRGSGVGGAAGVERVLRADPGVGYSPERLAEAMFANGWQTDAEDPARAARAAANRLRRDNPDEFKLEGGEFVFRPITTAGEAEVQTRFDPQGSPPGR